MATESGDYTVTSPSRPVRRARSFKQVMGKSAEIQAHIIPPDTSTRLVYGSKPGEVASSQVYDTGGVRERRARTFSQVIADATRGVDAGMARYRETPADLSSSAYAPDWRGHYLGRGEDQPPEYHVGKTYDSIADLPQSVKDKFPGDQKKQRQWMHVFNGEFTSHHDEGRAFASAWSTVGKSDDFDDEEEDDLDDEEDLIAWLEGRAEKGFDPSEARDDHGMWTGEGGTEALQARAESAARSNGRNAQPATDDANTWFKKGPSDLVDAAESRYASAGKTVSGLEVTGHVPNMSSIDASFTDYEQLDHVRQVPFSDFVGPDKPTERTIELAQAIHESGKIAPLIVGVDDGGPYIVEGAHRYDALQYLGVKSFPAIVVVDTSGKPVGKANDWHIEVRVEKLDEDQNLVFGWASIIEENGVPIIDRQGDEISEEDLEKAFYGFAQDGREADELHVGPAIGKMVECMVFTKEKQRALGINLGKVGAWVGFEVSPEVFAKVKDGRYPMFSIGGTGRRIENG